MNKSGFWNFFGLASWRNMKEVSQEVVGIEAKMILNIKDSENRIIDTLKKEIINSNKDMEQRIVLSVENATAEVIRKLDELQGAISSGLKVTRGELCNAKETIESDLKVTCGAICDMKETIENSITYTDTCMEKYYDRLYALLCECSAVINSTDWKIGTALAVFKDDLTDIVDRIHNMDPIVNLDKIETLLKILVINDMLDETKKISTLS